MKKIKTPQHTGTEKIRRTAVNLLFSAFVVPVRRCVSVLRGSVFYSYS